MFILNSGSGFFSYLGTRIQITDHGSKTFLRIDKELNYLLFTQKIVSTLL